MILPIRTDVPLRLTPYMNWALIVVNVAVYIVQVLFPQVTTTFLLDAYSVGERGGGHATYHYITSAFLHGGTLHLLSNMLFLYIFGNNVNDRLGHVGYLAFYLAGAVFAGLGHVVVSAGDASPVLGASGAVSAVAGAYVALLPRSHITTFVVFFMSVFEVPSLYFVLAFFAKDVFYNFSGADTGTAHMAHIAGTIFGFLATLLCLTFGVIARGQWDMMALISRWNRRRQYRDATRSGWSPFDHTARVAAEAPKSPQDLRVEELRAEVNSEIARRQMSFAAMLYIELKGLDPTQVLSRQNQLDMANQLASQQMYPQAAEAYEMFVTTYKNYEQMEQVELMLGLIYGRYLGKPDRARELLLKAMAKLRTDRERELAQAELTRMEQMMGGARRP